MELLVVFAFSFVTAMAIGYLAVASEQGVKIVAASKIGNRVGRWLFLFPIFELLEQSFSRIFAGQTIERIRRFLALFLLLVIVIIGSCFLTLSADWLWYFRWLIIGCVIFGGYSVLKRPRL